MTTKRLDNEKYARRHCSTVRNCVKCLSKIGNGECFDVAMLSKYSNSHPMYPMLVKVRQNINLCGKETEHDLSEIGCLYMKSMYYPQHCGIMELNDCE